MPEPPDDPEGVAFFETNIRPLLVENCQGCHGPDKQKAGLRLDSRAAVLAGGDLGPAIEPGEPDASLLIDAVRYDGFVQMPPKSKLTDNQIAALTKWVAQGATWPESNTSGTTAPSGADNDAFDLAARAQHWSFQAVRRPRVPDVNDTSWPLSTIDQFLLARLEAEELHPRQTPIVVPGCVASRST